MIGSLTLILVAVVVGLFTWWARRKYSYFRIRNIPHQRPTFPVGCLEGIGSEHNLSEWVKKIYSDFRQRGKFGGIFIGFEPVLIPTDLDLIREMLVTNFASFTDHSFYVNERDDPLSAILFSLTGERWRNLRTKLSATFSNNNTRNMFETVYVIGYDMLNYLEVNSVDNRKPFNAKNLAMRFICDSIGSCGFGLDCKAFTHNEPYLLTVAENLFPHRNFLLAFWILAAMYQKTSRFLRLKTFPTFVTSYFKAMINETVKYREENGIVRNDFMNLLIEIKNKGCLTEDESGEVIGNITYDELQAQAFVIFFAGFQTSRVTLTFALFELAVNPTIQQRVREEVLSHLTTDGHFTYEALDKMTYLHQVINETLRKYPPQVFLTRVASANHKLSGTEYTVKKGDHVYIPLIGIHYNPEIYPDPDRFDPDRMTPEQMKQRHPCSFMPFGMGPRICIGYRFGVLQVKLGVAMILSKYRLTVHQKTKQPLSFSKNKIELDVENGIWLNTHPL